MSDDKKKKRFGDRKDGKLVREIDGMHFVVPLIYPNRCDNEAFMDITVDLTEADKYLLKLNSDNDDFHYTLFHLIVTAMIRTVSLRPKMNRFIANKTLYQRNEISASFVVKKNFQDESAEGLAFVHAKPDSNLKSIHDDIKEQIDCTRSGKVDESSDFMDMFVKMPHFISRFIIYIITKLDKHGKVPQPLIATDPYYSSIVLSNLGSIGMDSAYHHLTNWGTNSIFLAVGRKKVRTLFKDDGESYQADSIKLGLTIDERIADGYYYSKTIKLLKYLLEHPCLLSEDISREVNTEGDNQ